MDSIGQIAEILKLKTAGINLIKLSISKSYKKLIRLMIQINNSKRYSIDTNLLWNLFT